ncbi:MAG: hypothetical protein DRP90_06950 [Planctomycetota bacterium]|nr:MAG: hypothetical protein DRP90_06950 [Planctomycetota bacterium]
MLAEPGRFVLSDAQLRELGRLMFLAAQRLPLDTGPYGREQVLLDFEFKVDRSGALKIKQVRPFLDRCRGIICDRPPEDYCKDAVTLVDYNERGTCDPQTGECRYSYVEVACEKGCSGGACLEE